MPHWLHELLASAQRLLTQPSAELNRWQIAVRYALNLAWNCYRELQFDQASQMAAALTYRTIFSLVPILVLSLVLFNAFRGFDEVSNNLQSKIFDQFGLNSLSIPTDGGVVEVDVDKDDGKSSLYTFSFPGFQTVVVPSPDAMRIKPNTTDQDDSDAGGTHADAIIVAEERNKTQAELRNSIAVTIQSLTAKISTVSFTSIGGVGLIVLVYAAISLAVTIENSFNRIYDAPQGRPWHLRISTYLTAIVMGPVLLSISIYFTSRVLDLAREIGFLSPLVSLASYAFALAASWLLLFLMYVLMPNANVHLRPALIGSFVAAVMWEIGKAGFKLYVSIAVPYSALYGALGLLPLFLFWVFITWWIVLFGFELTFALQAMKGRRFKHMQARVGREMVFDPRSIVAIARVIAHSFRRGEPVTASTISERVGLPEVAVDRFTGALIASKFVYEVEHPEHGAPSYTLAKDAAHIPLVDIVDVGEALGDAERLHQGRETDAFLDELKQREHEHLQGRMLADTLDSDGEGKPPTPDAKRATT